jgi:hypothetical protein
MIFRISLLLASLILATGQVVPINLSNIRSVDGSEDACSAPDAELLCLSGPAAYPNGVGNGLSMVMEPNARGISNLVCDELTLPSGQRPRKSRVSNMLWQWGQFMDHDIGLTKGVAEPFSITSPDCTNDIICNIPMNRALFHWSSATPPIRKQLNEITGFLDASNVYGHSNERAAFLRGDLGNNGRMKMSAEGLLPDSASLNLFNALPGGRFRIQRGGSLHCRRCPRQRAVGFARQPRLVGSRAQPSCRNSSAKLPVFQRRATLPDGPQACDCPDLSHHLQGVLAHLDWNQGP